MLVVFTLNMRGLAYGAEDGESEVTTTNETMAAENVITSTSIEYLEDGTCLETTITSVRLDTEESTDFETSSASTTSSSSVIMQATKTLTAKNDSGEALWSVTVTGTFRVITGVSSTCTSAVGSAAAISPYWKVSDVTTAYSGNTARATATGTKYWGIIKMETSTHTVALACDVYGNMN
jgi:hypothetical protein